MYYATAEKKHHSLFTRWSARLFVIDCASGYLYFTTGMQTGSVSNSFSRSQSQFAPSQSGGTPDDTVVHRDPTNPALTFQSSSSLSIIPADQRWKRVKLIQVIPIAREDKWQNDSPNSVYLMHIHGDAVVDSALPPHANNYLCPSTGPLQDLARHHESNVQFLLDPYFQKELYEAIRDVYAVLRRQEEIQQARQSRNGSRTGYPSEGSITSAPGGGDSDGLGLENVDRFNSSGTKESGMTKIDAFLQIRFFSELDYWRFYYVAATVLGQPGLQRRPYYGYPPYDPRNDIGLCPFPTPLWKRMKWIYGIHHAYTYIHGHLINIKEGKLVRSVSEGYLSLSHDYFCVFSDGGRMAQWLPLLKVHSMHYNSDCEKPYIAILSDVGNPDIVFMPTMPSQGTFLTLGKQDIRKDKDDVDWFCRFQVKRLAHILQKTFSGAVEPRRVIIIREAPHSSVAKWVTWKLEVERATEYHSQLTGVSSPTPMQLNAMKKLDLSLGSRRENYPPFPMVRISLRRAWETFGMSMSTLNIPREENVAVPLYEVDTNAAPLTSTQVDLARGLLEREAVDDDGIVGVALESLTELGGEMEDDLDGSDLVTRRRNAGSFLETPEPSGTLGESAALFMEFAGASGSTRIGTSLQNSFSFSRIRYFRENQPAETGEGDADGVYGSEDARYIQAPDINWMLPT